MPLTPEQRRERRLQRIRQDYVDPFRAVAQSALEQFPADNWDTESTTGSRFEEGDGNTDDWASLAISDDGSGVDAWDNTGDHNAELVRAVETDIALTSPSPDVIVPPPPGAERREPSEEESVSASDVENFLVALQARREVPIAVMIDLVQYIRSNAEGISVALRNGEVRSFRAMREHAMKDMPAVAVDITTEDTHGNVVLLRHRKRFPRKEIIRRRLTLLHALYYVRLSDLYEWHCNTHGSRISSRTIDISIDGVPESRSSGLSIDVLSVRFSDCSNVYALGILKPWKKRLGGKDEAIMAPFLADLPGSGLKVRRIIADAPKRAPLQGLKSHASNTGCPYCKAEKVNGRYPSSTMGKERRTDGELRAESEAVAAGERSNAGVKGVGLATPIPGLDLVRDIPAECMHCIHLGVVRKMVKLMYKQKTSQGGQKLYPVKFAAADDTKLNQILRKQKALSHFSRRTRDLDCTVYKAEEYRNLLLCYWPAVVETAPREAVKVWLLTVYVVRAAALPDEMYENLKDDLTSDLLPRWYIAYEKAFTAENCTHYTHVFHHLDLIRAAGPLDETSASGFEDFYAIMKQNYRAGTTATGSQALVNTMLAKKVKHSCKRPRFLSLSSTERVEDRFVYLKDGRVMKVTNLDGTVRAVQLPTQRAVGLLPGLDFSDVLIFRVDLTRLSSVESELDPSTVLGKCVITESGYCSVFLWSMLSM